MLIRIEPRTAPQKPLTWKPLTTAETSQSIRPLMTRRKRPRVRTVIGRVKKMRIGRRTALTITQDKRGNEGCPHPVDPDQPRQEVGDDQDGHHVDK